MRNAIAVFITCNAIHATAISLPLSLLSGRAWFALTLKARPAFASQIHRKCALSWVDLGRPSAFSRIWISRRRAQQFHHVYVRKTRGQKVGEYKNVRYTGGK